MANIALPANGHKTGIHLRHGSQDLRVAAAQGNIPSQAVAQHKGTGSGANGNGFGYHTHRRNGHGSNGAPVFTREPSGGTKSTKQTRPTLHSKSTNITRQDTSHVPCRFFMVGNCQAGKACPFSHTTENINNPAPCKYFAKGNCKYGYRCANPHMMPDGTDARKQQHARQPFRHDHRGPFQAGPSAEAGLPGQIQRPGFDPSQMLRSDQNQRAVDFTIGPGDRAYPSLHNESRFSSHPSSQYGSPGNDSRHQPTSPPMSALDATLPPTFDSNGAVNFALDGPASLPSRFGLGSSSITPSTANITAFANLDFMARRDVSESYSRQSFLASSPPTNNDQGFASRVLYSDRLRQPDNIATSLPISRPIPRANPARLFPDEDSDEENFNLLPDALSDEIMTPDEKMRRFSRHEEELSASARHSYSNLGSSPDSKFNSPKFGSPSAASPTGWGPILTRKARDEITNYDTAAFTPSKYGHVGSPLRNSSLQLASSPATLNIGRQRDAQIASLASAGKSASAIGMLSQQFDDTRLRDGTMSPDSSLLVPQLSGLSTAAHSFASNTSSGMLASNPTGSARMSSTTSGGNAGRTDRIDEEPSIFEMDEVDLRRREKEKQNRLSGHFRGMNPWNAPAADTNLGGQSSQRMSAAGRKNDANSNEA